MKSTREQMNSIQPNMKFNPTMNYKTYREKQLERDVNRALANASQRLDFLIDRLWGTMQIQSAMESILKHHDYKIQQLFNLYMQRKPRR